MRRRRTRTMKKVCKATDFCVILSLHNKTEVQTELSNSFEVSNNQYDSERSYDSDDCGEIDNSFGDYYTTKNFNLLNKNNFRVN